MSGQFGAAIAAALEGGDLGPIRACLLQRVRMEAGLDEFAGRNAVLGWFQALSAAFNGPRLLALREIRQAGIVLIDFRLEGLAANVPLPGAGRPAVPVASADVPVRLWFRLEQQLAVEATAIVDWTRAITACALKADDIARAAGAASPCHRPLGELISGRGQLGPEFPVAGASPADRWVAAFNARSFPQGASRDQCREVVAQMPDAILAIEQELTAADSHILLLRLMGHSNGRRVSLAASKVIGGEWDAGGAEPLVFDPVALAAVPHRPFHLE